MYCLVGFLGFFGLLSRHALLRVDFKSSHRIFFDISNTLIVFEVLRPVSKARIHVVEGNRWEILRQFELHVPSLDGMEWGTADGDSQREIAIIESLGAQLQVVE